MELPPPPSSPVLQPPAARASCWACKGNIDQPDDFCRHCGKGQGRNVLWHYKHWGVVVLFFCVGPFALYPVWRSPVISRTAKWIYTALMIAGTIYLIQLFTEIMRSVNSMLAGYGSFSGAGN